MVSFNPTCWLPSGLSQYAPKAIACRPPPSYLESVYQTITSPLGSTYITLWTAMDALMSLPFLSFILIPTMTSYSTSLNLLFFYLTWSTLVLSHPPLRVEIVSSLAVQTVFYVLPSSLFLSFDILFPSISENLKSLGRTGLPFRDFSRRRAPRHFKVIAWSLFNIVLAVALQAAIEYTLVNVLQTQSALRIKTTLPLPWQVLKDFVRGLVLRDALAYLVHRYLLHSPSSNALTRDLSALHRIWYHAAVRAPFPLSASYDHPFIYILHTFLPTYLPAYFFRFHALTYIVYLLFISLEFTFTHSGYSTLPTNFILGGIARRHDLHCLTDGEGNYGTIGICDWIFGTSIGGDIMGEVIAEAQEAELDGRIRRRARQSVRNAKKVKALINGEDPEVESEDGEDEKEGRQKKDSSSSSKNPSRASRMVSKITGVGRSPTRTKSGGGSRSSGNGGARNRRAAATTPATTTTRTRARTGRRSGSDDDDDDDYQE